MRNSCPYSFLRTLSLSGREVFKSLCIALPLGALMILSGCASLPTSGQPQAFDVDVPTPSAVDFVAGAPTKGASPQALIEGFLRACSAGTSDNFDTARLFLTRDSARTWEPSQSIHIYATDATPQIRVEEQENSPQVHVSAPAVASVDDAGILRESVSGTLIQTRFNLVQENGEWRILAPEGGIIISAAAFNATYQLTQVFFPANAGSTLISEAHWFARKRLAQHLVESLLLGPSEHIKPVAETAIPADIRLGTSGVDVRDGQADVWLEGSVPQSVAETDLMLRQITQTMRQSAQVRQVAVYVNGELLQPSSEVTTPSVLSDSAVAMTDNGVGMVTNGQFVALEGNTPLSSSVNNLGSSYLSARWEADMRPRPEDLLAMHPTNPAEVAWVGEGQLTVVDRDSGRTHRVGALQASWPSMDRFGWVWAVAHGNAVTVTNVSGQSTGVSPANVPSGILNIRISPDGNRALFIRRLGSEDSAWVGVVLRDRHGVPQGIANAYPLPRVTDEVIDISWVSPTVAMVLQNSEELEASVVTVPLGGLSQSMLAPEGARFVTAGGTGPTVYVTDSLGQVWLRANALWQPVEDELRSVRFPG